MKEARIAIIDHVGMKAGMDYYTRLLAKGFVANKVHPIVISNFKEADEGVSYYPCFIGHTNARLKKMSNHVVAFIKAAIICRKNDCNTAIIHLFSYELKDIYALRILHLWGIKVIAIVHDVESFAQSDSKHLQQLIFAKLTDWLIVHNQFSYDILMASYANLVGQKTTIVPHGNFHELVQSSCSKASAKVKLSLDAGLKYLLFFGQIKDVKGLDVLIKAMPLLPEDVRLIIAGKPWKSDFAQYQSLIDALRLNQRIIQRIGFIDDEERDLLFRACDLLVLPYKQIFQSGVMLMAMSYKIPLLASDLAPMKELVVHKKTGFLFETENEIALAEAAKEALSNPVLLNEVADNAWAYTYKKHHWGTIASCIIALKCW